MKAVEYWIKSKFEARPELEKAAEFVHFACTSEDINNTSHALQLRSAATRSSCRAWTASCQAARDGARSLPTCPCSAAPTARRPAPPPWAKEMANVVMRLQTACEKIAAVKIMGKMNGAVGNYNAHLSPGPTLTGKPSARRSIARSKRPSPWAWA